MSAQPISTLVDLRAFADRRRDVLAACTKHLRSVRPPLKAALKDLGRLEGAPFLDAFTAAVLLHDGRAGCPFTIHGGVHDLRWRADPGAVYVTLRPHGSRRIYDLGAGEYPPGLERACGDAAQALLAGPIAEALLPFVLYWPGSFPVCPFSWECDPPAPDAEPPF